jgi:hypothetical protein
LKRFVFIRVIARADRFGKRTFDEGPREHSKEDPVKSLEQTIFNMGNKHPTLTPEEDVLQTAKMIVEEFERHGESIASVIAACVLELPNKMENYSSLLVQVDKTDLSSQVLEKVKKHMKDATVNGPWRHFTQAIRFFATCTAAGILEKICFAELLSSLVDLVGKNDSSLHLVDFILWTIAAAAPLAGPLGDVFPSLETDLVGAYEKRVGQASAMPKDLVCVWNAMRTAVFVSSTNYPKEMVNLKFEISSLIIDSNWDGDFQTIHLFDDAFTATEYEQWTISYWCRHLIESFELNHRRCADVLLFGIPSRFGAVEKIVAQFLFGELIRNRANRISDIVYETVLMDCCRLWRAFPPAMARSLFVLYERLDEVGFMATDRLAAWFAHHLSNFDYKWNWSTWSSVLTAPPTSMQYIFVRVTLEKLQRLSYYDRVVATLPEGFKDLLNADTAAAPKELADDEVELLEKLCNLIRNRHPIEEIKAVLGDTSKGLDSMQRDVLLQSLLLVGSISLSHMQAVVEKFLPLFQLLLPPSSDAAGKVAANIFILDQLVAFWRNSMVHFEFIVERLVNYRILLPRMVIRWIMERSEEHLSDPSASFYETIIHVMGRGIILRTVQQAFMMPAVAREKMQGQPEDKITSTVANLQAEFEETLTLTLERLTVLKEQIVATAAAEDVISALGSVTIDLVKELVATYPNECGKVAKTILNTAGRRAPSEIVVILEQAHLQP